MIMDFLSVNTNCCSPLVSGLGAEDVDLLVQSDVHDVFRVVYAEDGVGHVPLDQGGPVLSTHPAHGKAGAAGGQDSQDADQ